MKAIGSKFDYVRAGLEQFHTYRGLRPVDLSLRLFAGYVWGDVPRQDEFYLSGGLTSNSSEPVSWAYEDWTSDQAHWHYDADANIRGYARQYPFDTTGGYLHGRAAYGINLEATLPKLGILSFHPFFDLGNVGDPREMTEFAANSDRVPRSSGNFWQPRMDAGVRLKLGPLYADFPFWRYQVGTGRHEFAFRWMLGFKMGGILDGT